MFVRGYGSGKESDRTDNSFYRGIVVKNNDPEKMNRVKVYIPNITNQIHEDWIDKYDRIVLKFIGGNIRDFPPNEKVGDWSDSRIFEELCNNIPWAEPCYPIMGESGNFRYYKDMDQSTISDCNYPQGFGIIDYNTPSLEDGSFSPSMLYEDIQLTLSDKFSNPGNTVCFKCNPYSHLYRPSNHTNKTKGVIGIPEVGSKVWVFHYEGDLNFPVYFGVTQDFRSLTLLNDTDNEKMISEKYPSDFEN